MSRSRHPSARILGMVAALAVLACAGTARAQGLTGLIDVSYLNTRQTLTDPTGQTTLLTNSQVPQRYRLSYDQSFLPYLSLSAAGLYLWAPGTSTTGGVTTEQNTNEWNVFVRAVIGPPVLNVVPFYQRREDFAQSRTLGAPAPFTPTLVNQAYGAAAGWNPFGLPMLGLQFTRTETFDSRHLFLDTATNDVQLSATYLEIQNLTLRYFARYVTQRDDIQSLDTNDFSTGGQVLWSGSFLDRRLTTSVAYSLGFRTTALNSGGGLVSLQQFPSQGLSLVEIFPSTPSRNTLIPNPALIDGDTTASAGIDIGFAPSMAGDNNNRDLGVQFPGISTPVNVIRVWVDRVLPAEVSVGYSWTAWQSDDNQVWVEVPLTGPVVFGPFDNRFEIPIQRTQARFLKVVTRPLAPAVTADRQYANVFVTEIQPWLVVPASEAPRYTTQTTGYFNGYLRLVLEKEWNVAYDFAGYFSHGPTFVPDYWSVLNAFSAGRQLSRVWGVNARIERTDTGRAIGQEAVNRLTAQVSADPFAGLGAALVITSTYSQLIPGNLFNNALTLLAHADPYDGVSLMGSGSVSTTQTADGKLTSGANAVVGLTLAPLRAVVFTGSWSYQTSGFMLGGNPASSLEQSTLQGSVSFTPVSAFFFSAGITRNTQAGMPAQNLGNLAASFSPFPQGQLVLSFTYNDTIDSGAALRSRIFGPSLRWNIRPGTYLNMAYTWNDSTQPSLAQYGEGFFTQLVVAIR